jgi:hypothetical protein
MARSRVLLLTILLIILSTVACTSQSATVVATPSQTSSPIPPPTIAPTLEPTISIPTPSQIPTSTPAGVSLYLPNGIASFSPASGNVGTYNLQGQSLGELQAPNLSIGPYPQAAFVGALNDPGNPILPPLVYYAYSNGGELWQNNNNNNSLVKAAPNLLNIIGVPGKPFIAYTQLQYLDAGLESDLYLTDIGALSTAEAIIQTTSSESYAIQSLAISMDKDQPTGIYYTTVPYGIGGDIIFAPRKSLDYLELANYQITTKLDSTKAPVGISTDQTWTAFTPASGIGPISVIHNFDAATIITFPLRADSDRGSGDAVFSPDNQYIAWREAGGSLSGEPAPLRETIRIGSVDGSIITEIPDTTLVAASGLPEVNWVIPVGWLDPQTLAVEVRAGSANNAALLTVKFDGSAINYLVPGSFIGFLYP